jgi:hypothetical protein
VDLLLHGTIVASYAILGRTSTASGLLTTRGFRDVLKHRPSAHARALRPPGTSRRRRSRPTLTDVPATSTRRRSPAARSPWTRDRGLIERDLADGKISRDYAERWHGVIVHPMTLAINRAASLQRRSELRRAKQAGGAGT